MNDMKQMKKTHNMLLLGIVALLLWAAPSLAQSTESITLPSVSLQVQEIVCPPGSAYTQLPGSQFEFVLEGKNGAPMPAGSVGNTMVLPMTIEPGESGNVLLSGSLGTLENTPIGLHTYTVHQRLPANDLSGEKYAYDPSVYEMQIFLGWKDGIAGGELMSTIVLSKGDEKQSENKFSFLNQVVFVNPPIQKTVVDDPLIGDLFTFEMQADDPLYPMPPDTQEGVKSISAGAGGVDFGFIPFVQEGTYTYTLREGGEPSDQYEYDVNQYQLKIVVTTNNGVFSESHSFSKIGGASTLQNEIEFTNLYIGGEDDPEIFPVEISFPGGGITKALSGATPAGRTEFVFDIVGKNISNPTYACPMPQNATGGETSVTIMGTGRVNPGTITFSRPGEYEYTITERRGSTSGYTYSRQTYKVYIDIRDDGDGVLYMNRCDIYADGGQTSSIVFTNAYSTSPGPPEDDDEQWYSTPKTGDETNIALMWVLSGLSGAGMALCAAWPRRRKRL